MRAAVGVPLIATTRVVDMAAAERLIESGAADAVGMTRALIADPELVEKAESDRRARRARVHRLQPGLHRPLPRGRADRLPRQPAHRSRAHAAAAAGGERSLRVLVVGAGPAGVAAAVEAAAHGDAVTLVDRARDVGGQLRLAGRAPAHHELWRRWRSNAARQLEHPGIACGSARRPEPAELEAADVVVLATGARPYVPDWAAGEQAARSRSCAISPAGRHVDAWTAIANPAAVAGPVLVADWGGGWEGLDAAEALAGHGLEVTLACAAPCPGGTLHQYQRNLYLARLDERGVAILHHTEVTGAGLRHLFSGRIGPLPARGDDRPRPGSRARGRAVGRAGGSAGPRARRRRARPALGRGGDARGRHRAAGRARRGR